MPRADGESDTVYLKNALFDVFVELPWRETRLQHLIIVPTGFVDINFVSFLCMHADGGGKSQNGQ